MNPILTVFVLHLVQGSEWTIALMERVRKECLAEQKQDEDTLEKLLHSEGYEDIFDLNLCIFWSNNLSRRVKCKYYCIPLHKACILPTQVNTSILST